MPLLLLHLGPSFLLVPPTSSTTKRLALTSLGAPGHIEDIEEGHPTLIGEMAMEEEVVTVFRTSIAETKVRREG